MYYQVFAQCTKNLPTLSKDFLKMRVHLSQLYNIYMISQNKLKDFLRCVCKSHNFTMSMISQNKLKDEIFNYLKQMMNIDDNLTTSKITVKSK